MHFSAKKAASPSDTRKSGAGDQISTTRNPAHEYSTALSGRQDGIMPGYMTYREAALMFSLMPKEEAADAIKATVDYYLYGTIPDLTGVAAQVFEIMRSSSETLEDYLQGAVPLSGQEIREDGL